MHSTLTLGLAALVLTAIMGSTCITNEPSGRICTQNSECGIGFYCKKPDGQCDAEGVCESRPEVCTEEFAPVCGCDGQTYPNACHAARNGVSVAAQGQCQ